MCQWFSQWKSSLRKTVQAIGGSGVDAHERKLIISWMITVIEYGCDAVARRRGGGSSLPRRQGRHVGGWEEVSSSQLGDGSSRIVSKHEDL